MKLKRIHLSNDRILSNNEKKLIIGGGDEDITIDGGYLPEIICTGHTHTSHEGAFTDCPECEKIIKASQAAGNIETYGNIDDNEYIYNMQFIITYGTLLYHYGNQLYDKLSK